MLYRRFDTANEGLVVENVIAGVSSVEHAESEYALKVKDVL